MYKLDGFPKNREKFTKLIEFLKEVLAICTPLEIVPVLSGSLAVFVYSGSQEIEINDIDLSCPEKDFARIIKVLEERNIAYKLKEYHVLQVLNDDLKIEFDSAEYWFKNLPNRYETLQVGHQRIKMVDLDCLRELYKRGMDDTEDQGTERTKYEKLKVKYELLGRLKE